MIYQVVKCDKCSEEFSLKDDGSLQLTIQDIGGGVVLHFCPKHGKQLLSSLEKYVGAPLVQKPEQQEFSFDDEV